MLIRRQGLDASRLVRPHSTIPSPARNQLRQFSFTDTIDKLNLRIALATEHKVVVFVDPDLWDPSDSGQKRSNSAAVHKLCRDALDIRELLLSMLLSILPK